MTKITTKINKTVTDDNWKLAKNHCRTTVGKDFTDNTPSNEFKEKLLISEHSPIRTLFTDWTWENMPYWVSQEHGRHKYEKFIKSQRDDRNKNNIPRGKKPQEAPVTYDGYANAQNLIDMARKRLCYNATKEAREYAESLKEELYNTGATEIANVMQKNCIYRCGCPEFTSCGYWNEFCKQFEETNDLLNIENRYNLENKAFKSIHNIKDN